MTTGPTSGDPTCEHIDRAQTYLASTRTTTQDTASSAKTTAVPCYPAPFKATR